MKNGHTMPQAIRAFPGKSRSLSWFVTHLIIYSIVLVSVVAVNMAVAPSHPWFLLILFGWCGLLILHVRHIMGSLADDRRNTGQHSPWQAEHQEKGRFFDLFSKGLLSRKGAVAVEYALILPVYMYLLVGIIEVSLLFFTTTVVDGAIQDSARQIRTGQAQLSGDALTTFQAQLCSSLLAVYDCDDMTLDVKTFDSFSTVTIPTLHYNDDDPPILVDEDDVPYTTGFTAGGSGEITVVRVLYSWNFFTPLIGELLGSSGNSRLLSTTAVFRNEPYE